MMAKEPATRVHCPVPIFRQQLACPAGPAVWRYMWLPGLKPIIRRFAGIRDGEWKAAGAAVYPTLRGHKAARCRTSAFVYG